jgi:predicted metal-dependent peptidase
MDAMMKISRGKTRLLLQQPFWGSLAMATEFIEDNTIPTMCTNGRWIRWSRKFVDQYTEAEILGVIVHELAHKALGHMLRRKSRDPKKWNHATDYVINNIVLQEGFELPKDGLFDKQYSGMMAEKVYDLLPDPPEMPTWGIILDDMSDDERAELEQEINQQLVNAANAAKSIGKLPAFVKGLLAEMEEAQIDYREKMRRFFVGDQPDDYTFRKPERKAYHHMKIIAPSVDHKGAGHWVIGVDTSGSVSDKELKHFLGEVNSISQEVMPQSITIIYCSMRINHIDTFEHGDEVTRFNYTDRGGTLVMPVFDHVRDNDIPCDQMVYLTDLEVFDWPDRVDYPLLWVSSGRAGDKAPIGETVRIIIKD